MRQGFLTPGGLSELPKIFAFNSFCIHPQIRRSFRIHPQVLGVNQFPVS
jgi:hypothetical protein